MKEQEWQKIICQRMNKRKKKIKSINGLKFILEISQKEINFRIALVKLSKEIGIVFIYMHY